MERPLVSVIIPNYNHARYLEERIESILAQTYQNFEIIILDDCSTDNSKSIIECYRSNPHVSHILYNNQNTGSTFLQWKRGIELAGGELCYIAESDDYCSPQLFERLVGEFCAHNDIVLAVCRTFYVDEQGKIIGGLHSPKGDELMDGCQFISKNMVFGNYIANSGMAMFRKQTALNIAGHFLDRKYAGAGDMMFWIEISEKGKVAIIDEQLNYFRIHKTNQTARRELDGSNSMARKYILEYESSRRFVSWWKRRLVYRNNLEQIAKTNGMPDDIRIYLNKTWHMSRLSFWFWTKINNQRNNFYSKRDCAEHPEYYNRLNQLFRKTSDIDYIARELYGL